MFYETTMYNLISYVKLTNILGERDEEKNTQPRAYE